MIVLREVRPDAKGFGRGRHSGNANGQAADFARCTHVALEQGRRHLQHARDVVEAVALIVGGDERRGIDVEHQQVANRVLVFEAIEPVERFGAAGMRPRDGVAVELVFQPRRERVDRRLIGPRRTGGRHRSRAQLPDDLFPDRSPGGDVVHIDRLEREGPRPELLVMAPDAVLVEDGASG